MTTDHVIEVGGIRSRYVLQGDSSNPPIILMHGWGCNASTLDSIQRAAALANCVYNFDLPGFGQSSEPAASWGVYDYADWLLNAMKAIGIERASLLGHSYGGRIAIAFAAAHPQMVDKLILVDAAGIKPRRPLKYYCKVYWFKLCKFAASLLGKAGQKWIAAQRDKRGSADYRAASPVMKQVMSRSVNQDLTPLLSDIKAPTLLIWGENDTATPLRDAKLMEKRIPDAGLVAFPGCGHYSFLDNPRQFAAVLRSFLSNG
ncbi:MAG: alpha/beta hydrolase [Clostridium sp.]|nr:alpha/beta hydrolase [Clostridium sp.]